MTDGESLIHLFSTPAIHHAGMSEAEWNAALSDMHKRSVLTQRFVNGQISPDDFLDGLHDQRIDVYHCLTDWENGISYM